MIPTIGHRIPDMNYMWLNILRTNLCYAIAEPSHNQMKLRELSHRCSLQLVVWSCCPRRLQSATTRRGPWPHVKPEPFLQPAVGEHLKRGKTDLKLVASDCVLSSSVSSLFSTSAFKQTIRRSTCTQEADSQLTGKYPCLCVLFLHCEH